MEAGGPEFQGTDNANDRMPWLWEAVQVAGDRRGTGRQMCVWEEVQSRWKSCCRFTSVSRRDRKSVEAGGRSG